MHMLGTFTVPALGTVNLHHVLSLQQLLDRRQKYNMLTSSLSLYLPKCPLAYSRCHSVLRTRLALPLLQSASLQSRNTSQSRSSSHGFRVRAMTTESTQDASKATATEMKQVSNVAIVVRKPSTAGSFAAQGFIPGSYDGLCCRVVFSLANGLSLQVRVQRCLCLLM